MRPLALFLGSLVAGSAFAQSSQPSDAPASAPASIPVVVTTITSPPVTNIQPPTKAEPIPPKKVALPEVHFLLQAWYDSAPAADIESSFRIRRAQLDLRGEIIPKRFKYDFMIEFTKEVLKDTELVTDQEGNAISKDDIFLQDAWVAYTLPNGADFQLGQFRVPISREWLTHESRLYFPERSPVSLFYGNRRDLGVSYSQKKDNYFYSLGFFNGNNINEFDPDEAKDVAGRFEIYPRRGLMVGLASQVQVLNDDGSQRTRFEFDAKYEDKKIVVASELHMGTDGDIPSAGGYLLGMVPLPFDDRLQLGGRFSLLVPNMEAPNNNLQEFTLGTNLFLKDHNAKLQGSVSRFLDTDPDQSFTQIIISGQAWF
jgi:hypothetical protein